jgi:hypothetical protein
MPRHVNVEGQAALEEELGTHKPPLGKIDYRRQLLDELTGKCVTDFRNVRAERINQLQPLVTPRPTSARSRCRLGV